MVKHHPPELTGAKTRARQIANLRQNGIRHTIHAADWPIVARAVAEDIAAAAREPERKP